ncbi:MAG: hypothetical protein AAB508_05585 [Patescibacteria group bacterium]
MILESALESLAVIPEIPTKLDLGTIVSFRVGLIPQDGGGTGITTERSAIKNAEERNIGIVHGGIQVGIYDESAGKQFVSSVVCNNLMTLMLWDEGVRDIASEGLRDVDIGIIRPRILVREKMTLPHAVVHQKLAIIPSSYSLQLYESLLNDPNIDTISQKEKSPRGKEQLGIVSPWIEDFQNNTVYRLVENKAITHKEFLGVLIAAARLNKNMIDHGVIWEDQASEKLDNYLLERQDNGRLRLILSDLDIHTIRDRESVSLREKICQRSPLVSTLDKNLTASNSLSSFRLSKFWEQFIRPEHDDSLVNLFSLLQRQTVSLSPPDALAKGIEILTQIRTEMKDTDTLDNEVVIRYAQDVAHKPISLDDLRKPGNSRETSNREELFRISNAPIVRQLLGKLEKVPGFNHFEYKRSIGQPNVNDMSVLREALEPDILQYVYAYPTLVRLFNYDARACFERCLRAKVLMRPWDKGKFDEFFSSPDVQQLAEELFKNATVGEK